MRRAHTKRKSGSTARMATPAAGLLPGAESVDFGVGHQLLMAQHRMGGRVDEGGSLENCCTLAGTLGSNPSPSASSFVRGLLDRVLACTAQQLPPELALSPLVLAHFLFSV